MFGIFVFRRFGLAVPITLLLVGFIMESSLDNKYGRGYYLHHLWAIGLNFFVSGIITGIVACIVDPADTVSSSNMGGYSLLDISDVGDKIEEVGSNIRGTMEHFITEPCEEDMFCYIPLNWCSLALTILGIMFIGMDFILAE